MSFAGWSLFALTPPDPTPYVRTALVSVHGGENWASDTPCEAVLQAVLALITGLAGHPQNRELQGLEVQVRVQVLFGLFPEP